MPIVKHCIPIKPTSKTIELKQKIDGFSMKNPVHIEAYNIPHIINEMHCNKSFMITPKTDGLTCHITMDGHVFESEKYCDNNGITKYYIFDLIRSTTSLSKKIESRLKTIQNLTCRTMLYCIDCTDIRTSDLQTMIHDIIMTEQPFGQHLIIKPVISIKNCKNIDMIKKLFNMLSTKPITQYQNDGWILYVNNHRTPLKFKPLDELTIDLTTSDGLYYARDCTDVKSLVPIQFSLCDQNNTVLCDNTIYRFLPQIENKVIRLIALSQRPDKLACNRTDTVEHIINRLKTNWLTDDVLDLYKSMDHVYYDHEVNRNILMDHNIEKLLDIQRLMSKHTMDYVDINGKVLMDLGCGNGSLGRYAICSKNIKRYYGVDIDPILLGSNMGNLPNQCLIWGDPNRLNMEFFTKYEESGAFSNVDVIMIMNSIHYFDLDMIMRICDLSDVKSRRIVIYGFFSENISHLINGSGTETIVFGTSFQISDKHNGNHDKDTYEFIYPWKSSPFSESIYRLSHVVETFKKHGWDIELCDTINIIDAIKSNVCHATAIQYGSFITMHNRIVFKKLT